MLQILCFVTQIAINENQINKIEALMDKNQSIHLFIRLNFFFIKTAIKPS